MFLFAHCGSALQAFVSFRPMVMLARNQQLPYSHQATIIHNKFYIFIFTYDINDTDRKGRRSTAQSPYVGAIDRRSRCCSLDLGGGAYTAGCQIVIVEEHSRMCTKQPPSNNTLTLQGKVRQ